MNFKEFTGFVDLAAKGMDQDQLQLLLHSIARKVPEEKRGEFAALMDSIREISDTKSGAGVPRVTAKKVDENEIRRELDRLEGLFRRIQSGELSIQADGYEDYSMGDGSDNWVWEYEGTDEVCHIYEDACRLLERCVNDGFYQLAVELFDNMVETEVTVENDWDDFTMGVEELRHESLISVDLESLAHHVLYAVYQVTGSAERAGELYEYFSISFFKEVSMENMLSLGKEELDGLPEFWDSWISLLSETVGDVAQRLLEEAVIYQYGEEGLLAVARRASEKHPSLYLKVLLSLERSHDSENQLAVGREALERVDKKYVLRSEIALKTAEAAICLGDEAGAQSYWQEAFISNSTPVNYLRLMVESKDRDIYRNTTKEIILSSKSYGVREYSSIEELTENFMSEYNRNILRFLSGDYDFVMDLCRRVNGSLGWSSTFMKCGISLLLLLLLNDNEPKQGCKKMGEIVRGSMDFSAETYFKGTGRAQEYAKSSVDGPDEHEVFWQCFTVWKSETHVMEDQAKQYLTDLEIIIDRRVRAIISGQFRAHYESVAELAAALGEVKESRGEVSAKETILQKYKEAFPRHSAFHTALRNCGMADTRKNKKR